MFIEIGVLLSPCPAFLSCEALILHVCAYSLKIPYKSFYIHLEKSARYAANPNIPFFVFLYHGARPGFKKTSP
jgi:hypothetical protein